MVIISSGKGLSPEQWEAVNIIWTNANINGLEVTNSNGIKIKTQNCIQENAFENVARKMSAILFRFGSAKMYQLLTKNFPCEYHIIVVVSSAVSIQAR